MWIDDSTTEAELQPPPGLSCGRIPRNYSAMPFGSIPAAQPFPKALLIPRSEWKARIDEKKKTGSMLSQVWKRAGLEPLDQNGTNYCWCNAVVSAIQLMRAKQNEPYIRLSPASAAAQIKGFSNEGGWGAEALAWIAEHGINSADEWPPNAIDRQYQTAANKAAALLRRINEWYDLPGGDFDVKATCLLLDMPVPSGYGWWSHEILGVDLDYNNDGFFTNEMNSWNKWGANNDGFCQLIESKSTPDDQLALLAVSATIK